MNDQDQNESQIFESHLEIQPEGEVAIDESTRPTEPAILAATQSAEEMAEIEVQRRRVFAGLPPEIQQNPIIRERFGLGDAVAAVAKPIAKLFGMKSDCKTCKDRQAKLNMWVPALGRRRRGPL